VKHLRSSERNIQGQAVQRRVTGSNRGEDKGGEKEEEGEKRGGRREKASPGQDWPTKNIKKQNTGNSSENLGKHVLLFPQEKN
jgi:hypothetical protein